MLMTAESRSALVLTSQRTKCALVDKWVNAVQETNRYLL